MTQSSDLSWAAGIFDGEGSVCVTKFTRGSTGTSSYRLNVSLTNTHKATVERFGEIAGIGRMQIQKRQTSKHRIAFRWIATNRQSIRICQLLLDWVFTKKKQLEEALAFAATISDNNRRNLSQRVRDERERIYQRIKYLNKVDGLWFVEDNA